MLFYRPSVDGGQIDIDSTETSGWWIQVAAVEFRNRALDTVGMHLHVLVC